MTAAKASTLRDLAFDNGLTFDDDPRLEWMVMTWDLAARRSSGAMLFNRFLLSGEALLVLRGHQAAQLFSPTDPPPAKVVHYEAVVGEALLDAESLTAQHLQESFYLVCRPLAVDCSALAPTLTDPFGLLDEIVEHRPTGTQVLRLVNTARAGARDTHLDPEALTHLPVSRVEQLWGPVTR